MKAMNIEPNGVQAVPQPVPAFGVRTCGKPAPGPLDFGPCRLDPGHEGGCQYKALGGTVTIENIHEGDPRSPLAMVREIEDIHARMRKAFRVTVVASFVTVASAAYLVTEAIRTLLG